MKSLSKLTPKQRKLLDEVTKAHIKSLKYHFKKHGWDIDYHIAFDMVLQDVFGNIEVYFMNELAANNLNFYYEPKLKRLFINKPRKKKK